MPQTPLSNSGSYLTAADFVKRYDVRTIGELLVDDDNAPRLAPQQVLVSAILAAIMSGASGELESALVAGHRQDPADIAAIAAMPALTPVREYLMDLLSALTLGRLLGRRPDRYPVPDEVKEARQFIELLRDGERILPTNEAAQAGVTTPSLQLPRPALPLVTDVAIRYFGSVWRPQQNLFPNNRRW